MSEKTPVAAVRTSTATPSSSRGSWKDQSISVPIGAILTLLGAMMGGAGALGMDYATEPAEVVTKADLVALQGDVRRLQITLDKIADEIDELHPRGGR